MWLAWSSLSISNPAATCGAGLAPPRGQHTAPHAGAMISPEQHQEHRICGGDWPELVPSAGATAGQRIAWSDGKVPETGSLGEASGSCAAGAGQGITAGQVGWVTVTLAAGRYELVCNLQNHYADGMHQEFTVT